ncbi:MAG TPA: phosphoenolpyruvate carboxykinase (ATP) [Gammaproteobacteria bacterium]|nr:phosphoenolpyruvate carboxykinase (ATP) [Gammaproteobacteria bacterium]
MSIQPSSVTYHPSRDYLQKYALENQEGVTTKDGVLTTQTGQRTGRSPKDRYIIEDSHTKSSVNWGSVNQPFSSKEFIELWEQTENYLHTRNHFNSDFSVGASKEFGVGVNVRTELAWHHLFLKNLFIDKTFEGPSSQKWELMSAPNFNIDLNLYSTNSEAGVFINFEKRKVLIIGMRYAGEMKKSMFTVLNYLLPPKDVLPMHCAANQGTSSDVTLFFGLSGTGKTTLSSDPNRSIIGDDEHGWSPKGVFNFEGGCYAKCINLSKEKEPVIWKALKRGAVMENVFLTEDGTPDFNNDSLTKNTRAAYPRTHITQRIESNHGPTPKSVVFLCCDLYGVLPAVSSLTHTQAAYYFLSGYTALVGSTEMGQTSEIKPTFSTCFGAPFFPRPPQVYAELLMKRLSETQANVYLVNTGWTGGAYGQGGERFDITTTRNIINAITDESILKAPTTTLSGFNLSVPTELPGLEDHYLNPQHGWSSLQAYNDQANILIEQFQENFKRFETSETLLEGSPSIIELATSS